MTAKPIIGETYRDIKLEVEQYAKKDFPLLLIGETGTGKELFAELYKKSSKRKGKRMTVNCAAFSDDLLRSEIFGHVQGAYTGATRTREGKIKACNGGILVLDELGDASQEFQAAILRVAESNTFSPLGSDKEDNTDTLIIAATSKLHKIRLDLRQRFHTLFIPPLQKFDIPTLAKHFLKRKTVKKEILDELMSLEYPGNVRQLEKQCQKVLSEKNDAIFDESEHYRQMINRFDYARYKLEIETWNEHIQTILDSNQSYGFKYAYQEWDDEWDDHGNDKTIYTRLLTHGSSLVPEDTKPDYKYSEELKGTTFDPYRYGIINLIELLKKYVHGAVPEDFGYTLPTPNRPLTTDLFPMFHRELTELFAIRSLPYLLKHLHQKYSCKPMVPQKKPSISFLLDLSPDGAEKKFKKIYYEYHLTLNNGSVDATASALNLNKNTLKSRLRRLKIDSI